MSFQIKFGKTSVADFNKESAFLLPTHKIHCAVISFSGSAEVAAGLSNFLPHRSPSPPKPPNLLLSWK